MDAAINLVPYIDLLMTIMTFLMMTAVWTQIAMLQVQNSSGNNAEPEEEEDKDKPKPIIVMLTEGAIKVQEEGGELQEFPQRGENPDFEGTKAALDALKKQRPDRIEVKVQAEDGVPYTSIASIIDTCTGLSLTGITLSPVASGS